MSLNISGEKCVVCKAYLFPEDDVVYCPQCGAPHHRDCYHSIGHCGLEQFHNTENEYKKPEPEEPVRDETHNTSDGFKTVCAMCGESFPSELQACPKCGTPDMSKMGGNFVTFDFLGGIPGNTDLGEGVTANEAKMFVNTNTHRYIPKFAGFKHGKKTSWNWVAFLAPGAWITSRKMYLLGAIISAVQIALTLLSVPFVAKINEFDFTGGYIEFTNLILENLPQIGKVALYTAFIGSFLDLILRIILGVYGDLIYRKRVISKVCEIKNDSEDKTLAYRKMGGVNLILGIAVFYLVRELPSLLALAFGVL